VSRKRIAGDPSIGVGRVIVEYDAAAGWLKGLGLDPAITRFGAYRQALAKGQGRDPATLPHDVAEAAVEALVPCLELVDIYRDLAPFVDARALTGRLHRLLRGPVKEADESTKTNTTDARNVGFELSTAASLQRSGLRVSLPEHGDLDVGADGATAAIECKRVQSANGIEAALAEAGDQLEERVDPATATLRIAAVDVSLLVRGPSHLVTAETNDQVNEYLAGESEKKLHPVNRSILSRAASDAIDAVVLIVSTPAHARGPNFWTRAEHRVLIRMDENLWGKRAEAFNVLRQGLKGREGVRRA